jgi:hypothetical protein
MIDLHVQRKLTKRLAEPVRSSYTLRGGYMVRRRSPLPTQASLAWTPSPGRYFRRQFLRSPRLSTRILLLGIRKQWSVNSCPNASN